MQTHVCVNLNFTNIFRLIFKIFYYLDITLSVIIFVPPLCYILTTRLLFLLGVFVYFRKSLSFINFKCFSNSSLFLNVIHRNNCISVFSSILEIFSLSGKNFLFNHSFVSLLLYKIAFCKLKTSQEGIFV